MPGAHVTSHCVSFIAQRPVPGHFTGLSKGHGQLAAEETQVPSWHLIWPVRHVVEHFKATSTHCFVSSHRMGDSGGHEHDSRLAIHAPSQHKNSLHTLPSQSFGVATHARLGQRAGDCGGHEQSIGEPTQDPSAHFV